jgi:acyl-CoA synthetase (NDP forming)
VPVFRTPESCADAIAAALSRRPPRSRPRPALLRSGPTRGLDEAESYRLLAEIGVQSAAFVVDGVDAPAARWAGLRYPVVVKALSSDLAHKSDVGGVVLGVETPDEVPDVAARLRDSVAARAEGLPVRRVLVQSMERGIGEVLVGYRVDPDAGPLVLVAMGGVLAEVYADRSLRLAPVDRATALDMLAEVAGLAVLRGYRGKPPGDLDALADLVVAVSQLARRPEVAEAEINPVLVRAAGAGVLALDAVVRLWPDPPDPQNPSQEENAR